jgi:hypothetical protein
VSSYLFRIKAFVFWWLNAVDEHSLHSPFFYDLYTTQIKTREQRDQFRHIESLREKLLNDPRIISVKDLGSRQKQKPLRRISQIARTNLSSRKFSIIFYNLVHYFKAERIVELGTSFGINTLYLAERSGVRVTTFEGSPAIADIAGLTFEFAGKRNINLIVGNIEKTFPAFLQTVTRVDLAFFDANHRYEPTMRYFEWLLKKVHERSVLVIDDIHYSAEMERAWEDIKKHRLVYGSADLFRCGIVFFDPSLNKQHVILQI